MLFSIVLSISISLDHFIRPREKLRRERKALLLSGLQVDDQLELRWLLYGKVARLRALEDLVYVGTYCAVQMLKIRVVGHESTCIHKQTAIVYRSEPSLGRELNDPCSMV